MWQMTRVDTCHCTETSLLELFGIAAQMRNVHGRENMGDVVWYLLEMLFFVLELKEFTWLYKLIVLIQVLSIVIRKSWFSVKHALIRIKTDKLSLKYQVSELLVRFTITGLQHYLPSAWIAVKYKFYSIKKRELQW